MEHTYPRVYRFGGWPLTFWLGLELLLIGGGVGAVIFAQNMFPKAAFAGWLCGGFFILLGLPAMISTLRGKLALYADRAEYTGILGPRVMHTADVVSTRNARRQYGHFNITIVLKSGRKVQITDFGRMDDALAEWIDSFPNEEINAVAERDERLLANPAFGGNPDEREKTINADAILLNWLKWPVIFILGWGFVYPQPYEICLSVLLALPVLTQMAVIASRGRWTLLEEGKSGRLSVGERPFIGVCLVLALRTFFDVHLVDWTWPLVYAAGAGVVLGLLSALIERQRSVLRVLGYCFCWSLFAWSGLLYADTAFASSSGHPLPAKILDMSREKYSTTLNLTKWGSRDDGNAVSVSSRLYDKLHKGETVCVYVFPGRLGLPWYEIHRCPAQKQRR